MSGGGKGDQTTTQKVEIPKFLQPFIKQGAAVGQDALSGISSLIQPGTSLVSPFNQQQESALQQAEAVAGGAGDFIPTAQEALLGTARGDFLFGGPGFNEAVQASIRAAAPNILSSFGAAGRGVSGLGQAAIQQAASDSFAGLFNNERSRQLQAAGILPDIGLAGSNILSQVGGTRQGQSQRELEGPLAAQERLFRNALGVTGSQAPLFGQSTTAQAPSGSKAGDIIGTGLNVAGMFAGVPPGMGKAGGTVPAGLPFF